MSVTIDMVYELTMTMTNGVVTQDTDGILARFVLIAATGLLIKTDYYTAPDCSKLCESGSASPKANGTQECNCQAKEKTFHKDECIKEANKNNNNAFGAAVLCMTCSGSDGSSTDFCSRWWY